jgi:hypothetical protein
MSGVTKCGLCQINTIVFADAAIHPCTACSDLGTRLLPAALQLSQLLPPCYGDEGSASSSILPVSTTQGPTQGPSNAQAAGGVTKGAGCQHEAVDPHSDPVALKLQQMLGSAPADSIATDGQQDDAGTNLVRVDPACALLDCLPCCPMTMRRLPAIHLVFLKHCTFEPRVHLTGLPGCLA